MSSSVPTQDTLTAALAPSDSPARTETGFLSSRLVNAAFAAGAGLMLLVVVRLIRSNRSLREERNRATARATQLATVLDNLGSYVYFKDKNYRYQYGNRRVCELFGLSPEFLAGKDDTDLFGSAHFDETRKIDSLVIEHGETQETVETHVIKADGSQHDYLSIKSPVRDESGLIVGLCGVSTDMSTHRALAQRVEQWEQRFSKMTSHLPCVIFQVEFEPNGQIKRVFFVSENIKPLTGLSPDDFDTHLDLALELAHPEDRQTLIGAVKASVQTLKPWVQEFRICHPEEGVRWLQGSFLLERSDPSVVMAFGFIKDITHQRAEQDVALDVQRRLNTVAFRVPGAIFQLDRWPDGQLAMPYVSDGLANIMSGLLPDQVKDDASGFFNRCHPEDLPWLRQSLDHALDLLLPWFHEFRILCPEGEVRWLRGSATPEAQSNGGVTAYGFLTDITEQQLAQHAVDELQERISKISSRLPGIIFQLESYPDGHTLMPYASFGSEGFFGATEAELRSIPDSAFALVHPEDKGELLTSLHRSGITLQPWVMHFRVLWPNSTTRWLRINATPNLTEEGCTLWHGYACDVTEERMVEERLREREDTLKSLYQLSPLGIALTNMAGQFLDFNPAFLKLFGYEGEELKSLDYWDVTPREYEQQEILQLESIARSGAYGPYEKEYIRKDGSRVPVRLNGVIIKSRDGEGYLWSIIEDMTESRAFLDELKRSNAELEQFAYAVSHDMRQPLRMVSSYLQIIDRTLGEQIDDETRSYMGFAIDGAKRMEQMILSLLEYSRVGRMTDAMDVLDSQKPLDEALAYLKPDIEATGGVLEIKGTWPSIRASHDEMTRLFQNLIGNALKYHPENVLPYVVVEACIKSPDGFRVEIRDNGIGIDPGQVDRLFQIFSRLQSRVRYEGVGVGLALCRKIVEHHHGVIGVTSEGEGKGSVFWFEIPVVHETGECP
ncbi:MAG: PAS domain-containing sensor histidine kinase [Methylococcaceae bacterium]